MSTLKVLKEYLIGDGGYLLSDDNNAKTVMLSGAWGSGKTHFWQNEIAKIQKEIEVDGEKKNKYTDKEYEEGLSFKLKEKKKSCVYISLYGKDSLAELKKEVFFRASTEKDYLSDDIEAFGFNALSTIDEVGGAIAAVYKVASNMNESRRDKSGINKLKDGGLICFDDFERKSKNIDLNDLFGFMSQLAINLNCKVVIILNSDVFDGEEANVFKTVKEKTVNKFFYFEPTIEELFNSIYNSEDKYKRLDEYKTEILNAIKLTEELNARIYIQVLDNCLEWIDIKNNLDKNIIKVLALGTFNFILNHIAFDYVVPRALDKNNELYKYDYKEINFTIKDINKYFKTIDNRAQVQNLEHLSYVPGHVPSYIKEKIFIDFLIIKNVNEEYIEKNKKKIEALWKYGYRLYYVNLVDKTRYNEIAQFIKTGILLKKDKKKS